MAPEKGAVLFAWDITKKKILGPCTPTKRLLLWCSLLGILALSANLFHHLLTTTKMDSGADFIPETPLFDEVTGAPLNEVLSFSNTQEVPFA